MERGFRYRGSRRCARPNAGEPRTRAKCVSCADGFSIDVRIANRSGIEHANACAGGDVNSNCGADDLRDSGAFANPARGEFAGPDACP